MWILRPAVCRLVRIVFITGNGVVEIPHIWGLFKNVQMRGAQKTEPRGVYRYTLSGAVCSATQQMSVFQQPRNLQFYSFHKRVELQAAATTGT
jgi:hypothetical protein